MIRSRRLSRAQWEAKLRRAGASPLAGKGVLNPGEWWKGRTGAPFFVLTDKNGEAEFWEI